MARAGSKDRGVFERPKGVWWARYATADGTERREKAGTKAAAKALYMKRKTAVLQGEVLPELTKKSYSFEQLAAEGLAWSKLNKSSWKDDEERLAPLRKSFGHQAADKLRASDFERWLDAFQLERNLAGATINRYRAVLQMVYREGNRRGNVKTNPAREIAPRKSARSIIRFLSDDEEKRLFSELRDPVHRVEVYFALLTGVRRSNQYQLKWEDVNLLNRTAHLNKTKPGGDQWIDLHPALVSMLAELPRTGEYVFRGGAVKRGYGMDFFESACRRAGVRNFTWHCLRHTFASRLAMAGTDLKRIKDAMGHKTITMTDRYSHLQRGAVREAVDALSPVTLLENLPTVEGRVN